MMRVACLSLILILPGVANALDLHSVLEKTAVTPPARVTFREERHNQMFEEALVLTGYLEYLDGGVLRKVVETPFVESLLVGADRIEIERDGETKVLPVSKSRALKVMLGGIEAVLAGQVEQLEMVFDHELTGAMADWSLLLRPRSRRVARQLTGLLVRGNDAGVTSIRFDLKGGEWHLMEVHPEKSAP